MGKQARLLLHLQTVTPVSCVPRPRFRAVTLTERETYQLTGVGTLTASLLLDGTWDLSRPTGTPFWQVQSSILFNANSSPNPQASSVCIGTACSGSISTANSGSLSGYLLTKSLDFNTTNPFAPNSLVIDVSLLTQIAAGNGLLDFGNTAKLLIETTGNLVATPSDPDFLSDPAFLDNPSAIPLPAGMVLMLTALAGLGAARLRRDRK